MSVTELRRVTTTRYVTPLREGGSMPAIVEGDDCGMYVLKFRGAGQGPKTLIAEILGGEIARAAGLRVPEIVLMELDVELARTEPDPEIQDLIRASGGTNLALDYLPGSLTFDPIAIAPPPTDASRIVVLDSFLTNVDRTARNPNLLWWHKNLWLIDHGAALYFHHAWKNHEQRATSDTFPLVKSHVLLPFASELAAAGDFLARAITPEILTRIAALIPNDWLLADSPFSSPGDARAAYVSYLTARLSAREIFVAEAIRARAAL